MSQGNFCKTCRQYKENHNDLKCDYIEGNVISDGELAEKFKEFFQPLIDREKERIETKLPLPEKTFAEILAEKRK